MLDYHSRSQTNTWPQPLTRHPAFDGIDSAAATMAQPTVSMTAGAAAAPAYAWSAEGVADDSAPAKRSYGLMRPMAVAGGAVVVAAAAAATVLLVFGGHSSSPAVTTSTVSTPITANHVAAPAPAPAPAPMTPPPARQAPVSRHQASASQSASTTYQQPDSTSTTSTDNSENQQHGDQWRPWHDTTQRTSNWNFFRPHFDFPDHHDGDQDRSRGHHDQQSSEGHSDSSSHGSE
ncbi:MULTISPECIES: hypothetical protein [unclassified Mycobacterium]|uniref:hypothetical protein n=1 Tax=unclassified Mycobacterium TaxID=2642494 RepID=UPI0029C835B5|nr:MULTISPECIES: hypothetical protein [unclassified Mycobacterium]